MSLEITANLDVRSAAPDIPSKVHLAIEIEAKALADVGTRPPSRTILALDVSGSMQGEPLDQVVRSVDRLLDVLEPADALGIVSFADDATTLTPPIAMDAEGKRRVRIEVARLFAEGQTNVEAGLECAASLLREDDGQRSGIVLLSDGSPNVGARTVEALREVIRTYRPRVSFFALGYGADHDEDILSAVGEAGGGGYELVSDPALSSRAFARALGAQADVVASGLELVVTLQDGVSLTGFLGREEIRFSRDGVALALPDMIAGGRRFVVAELTVEASSHERLLRRVARVRVAWSEPGAAARRESATDVSLEIAEPPPRIVPEAARAVLLVRADRAREDARALADRGQWKAASSALRATLAEIERSPGWRRGGGSLLAEAYELLVDEAAAMDRRPSFEAYAAFRKSAVASKLAAPIPQSTRARGRESAKLIEHSAGVLPDARLIVLAGASSAEHRLGEECVIGRTAGAHLAIESDSVARRHAEVYALDGAYWIADLGSTNATTVNGASIALAPKRLRSGDVIGVGAVEIRYEERPVSGDAGRPSSLSPRRSNT